MIFFVVLVFCLRLEEDWYFFKEVKISGVVWNGFRDFFVVFLEILLFLNFIFMVLLIFKE